MTTPTEAHQQYVRDLTGGTYHQPQRRRPVLHSRATAPAVLPDGHGLTSSILVMDSAPASTPSPASPAASSVDRVQALADHFTDQQRQREAADRASSPAYHDYVQRLARGEV